MRITIKPGWEKTRISEGGAFYELKPGDIVDVADEVAAALGTLPAVTTDDNDKVLTVDGGEWKAKTPSGGSGGGALVVTLTSSGSAMVANKTAGEIWTAAQTSAVVFVSSMGSDAVFPLISAMKQSSHYYFSFASVVDNSITAMTIEAVAADEYPDISMG